MKLYSRRFSTAKGNYWKTERNVTETTAQEWLKIYREDEPKVLFLVSNKKPT